MRPVVRGICSCYPGIWSDLDLHTFSYEFSRGRTTRPSPAPARSWTTCAKLMTEYCIDRMIRLHHKAVNAQWSTADARWLVEIERADTGERITMSCGWFFCASGYYRYDEGFTLSSRAGPLPGRVVHPQHWPEDLTTAVSASSSSAAVATAVTLVPAMAGTAAHVTMLQRSPTYIVPVPSEDRIANTLPKLVGRKRRMRSPVRRTSPTALDISFLPEPSGCGPQAYPSPQRQAVAGGLSCRRTFQLSSQPVDATDAPFRRGYVRCDPQRSSVGCDRPDRHLH